jgi:hypothetical protein
MKIGIQRNYHRVTNAACFDYLRIIRACHSQIRNVLGVYAGLLQQ